VTGGFAAIVLALLAAFGVYLLYTSWAFGWRGLGTSAAPGTKRRRIDLDEWLVQAGLEKVRPVEFLAVTAVLFVLGFVGGLAVFAGPVAATVIGAGAVIPIASARGRRRRRRELARDAWPRMLEEIRLQDGDPRASHPAGAPRCRAGRT
jgi:tight adherence protein B